MARTGSHFTTTGRFVEMQRSMSKANQPLFTFFVNIVPGSDLLTGDRVAFTLFNRNELVPTLQELKPEDLVTVYGSLVSIAAKNGSGYWNTYTRVTGLIREEQPPIAPTEPVSGLDDIPF